MKNSHGKMNRMTRKLKKSHRDTGIQPMTRYLREFKEGDIVHVNIVASEPSGMPHPKYQGKTGKIVGREKNTYIVKIKDGRSDKELKSAAVHLRPE
ncbi:MAG: 50S ribosomal protein L21e [Candidatus Diapherotrites archaeon]|nr:50S ribosomal protein L21e [Candidatus Diapherotrites archaeon]